jgi:flagellar hook capping protein FlgD
VKGVPQPYFAGIYQLLTGVVMPVTASPNPFGEKTAIRFTLDAPAPTRILLIDAHGRVVRRLHDGFLPAGRHAIAWNGRDGQRAVGSGVYFAEVLAGGRRSVSKVFHLK